MDLHQQMAARLRKMRAEHPGSWSAEHLAREVTALGVKMSRAKLSKLEMNPEAPGARLPTLQEFLAICHALDASPLSLLLPEGDESVVLFGDVTMDQTTALNWLTHTGAPDGVDDHWFQRTAPKSIADVNEASRITGMDIVQMAQHARDGLHESYQDTYYDQQRG